MLENGDDADSLLPRKKKSPDWLVGRQGKAVASSTETAAIPISEPCVEELTAKITQNLETEMDAKVNRKVQENMARFFKMLGEANPNMKFNVPDFCATFSTEQDDSGSLFTPVTTGGTTS